MFLFFNLLVGGPDNPQDIPSRIYDFIVPGLTGGTIDFEKFKGKKILIVNTASECGYTPQYEGLEALARKYKESLVVVAFPTNDFGGQEPGTSEQIAEFCKTKYDVTFPIASKITLNGPTVEPIYQWLTREEFNGVQSSEVKWNFQKYLINEQGKLIRMFPHKTKPDNEELISAIEN
jgi:glutathione peroxidase